MRNLKTILDTTPVFKTGDNVFYLPTQLFFCIGEILVPKYDEEISFYDIDGIYICSELINQDGSYLLSRDIFTVNEAKELGFD